MERKSGAEPGGEKETGALHHDAADRKRLDEALRNAEERFLQVAENAGEWIWEVDREGLYRYCSPAVERMLGYAPEELVGKKHFYDLFPPDIREELKEAAFAAFSRREAFRNFVNRNLHKNGETVTLETSGTPFFDERGNLRGYRGADTDITERERTAAALRESEENYRQLFDNAPVAIYRVDFTTGKILKANDLFCKHAGCRPEEVSSIRPYDYLTEESKKVFLERVAKMARGEEVPTKVEYEIVDREGRHRHVHLQNKTICNAEGKIVASDVVAHDITERKQMERIVQESEKRFRTAFYTSPDAVNINRLADGLFVDINDGFTRLTGYTRDDVAGKTSLEINLWHNPADRQELVKGLREKGYYENLEAEFRRKDGSIGTGLMSAKFIELQGGLHILSITRDITDRKRAEAERKKLEAQLTQAQKMESIGRLAGGVAHDFNNMLGVILGRAEMALQIADPTHPIYQDLQEIRKAAERSADLTRQLLAFARRQTVALSVLDLSEVVEGMLKMLRRLIGEDIDLAWIPGRERWRIRMDPSQIDQILANLCVNARDAIQGVGRVTIETGTAVLDEAYCADHAGFVPGEYVRLAVSDDGCGMDRETLDNLFEPFFTTKGVGEGTGLGLATVYGIVKQNNGFIHVYSEPGHGTTFMIYLPRYVGEAGQTEEKGPVAPVRQGHETILVVEDEPAILEMIQIMAERLGYAVLAASAPDEAIRLAETHGGEIHLLLTDLVMPGMNGRDLAKNLLAPYPELKQLFMSGYTANVIAHQGVLDEGIHFIQKPFTMANLAAAIRRALEE